MNAPSSSSPINPANQKFHKSIEAGDPKVLYDKAMCVLDECKNAGTCDDSFLHAWEQLNDAADMGYNPACHRVADFYVNKNLLKLSNLVIDSAGKDPITYAIEVLKLCNNKDEHTETRLMWLYLRPNGTPENFTRGMVILEKRASKSDEDAIKYADMLNTGLQSEKGTIPRNPKKAVQILENIIQKNDINAPDKEHALRLLEKIYRNGGDDFKADPKKAKQYQGMQTVKAKQKFEKVKVKSVKKSVGLNSSQLKAIGSIAMKVVQIAAVVLAGLALLGGIAVLIWWFPPAGIFVALAALSLASLFGKALGRNNDTIFRQRDAYIL